MSQEQYVLQCVSCTTFQSQIVKKKNKWECKVCGFKQSIKKVYGQGSGKDCRLHTQKLNILRGEKDINQDIWTPNKLVDEQKNYTTPSKCLKVYGPRSSRWAAYVNEEQNDSSSLQISNTISDTQKICSNIQSIKHKRKIDKGCLKDEHVNNVEYFNEFSDACLLPSLMPSTTNINNCKRMKLKNENSYENERSCYFNAVGNCEQEEAKAIHLKTKQQTVHSTKPSNSKKWIKYLEEKPIIKENEVYSESLHSNSAFVSHARNVNIIENHPHTTANTNYKINPIYSTSCNSLETSQKFKTHLNSCNKISFTPPVCKNVEIPQNKSYTLGTRSLFEQNCDLSDIDFQLDF